MYSPHPPTVNMGRGRGYPSDLIGYVSHHGTSRSTRAHHLRNPDPRRTLRHRAAHQRNDTLGPSDGLEHVARTVRAGSGDVRVREQVRALALRALASRPPMASRNRSTRVRSQSERPVGPPGAARAGREGCLAGGTLPGAWRQPIRLPRRRSPVPRWGREDALAQGADRERARARDAGCARGHPVRLTTATRRGVTSRQHNANPQMGRGRERHHTRAAPDRCGAWGTSGHSQGGGPGTRNPPNQPFNGKRRNRHVRQEKSR